MLNQSKPSDVSIGNQWKSLRSPALPLTNSRPGMVFFDTNFWVLPAHFVCRWMMPPGTRRLEGCCGKRMENMTTQWYHVYIYIYNNIYIYNYVYIYIIMYIYNYIYNYVYIYIYNYVYLYIQLCTYIYIYNYILYLFVYIYMYTHNYIYIYI